MSSKIQLIAQSKNKAGGAKNFELTAGMGDGGQAIRVQAESGVRYELLDLATRQGPRSVRAKRAGRDLEIFLEGSVKADAVIEGYYDEALVASPADSLTGLNPTGDLGVYVIDAGLRPALSTLASDIAPIVLSNAPVAALPSWGVAAGAFGAGIVLSSAFSAPAVGDLLIKGSVTAGPVSTGVKLYAYDSQGKLLGMADIQSDGTFSITVQGRGDYRGTVLLKAVDSNNNAANYLDEVTASQKSIDTELRAMGLANETQGAKQFSVNGLDATLVIHITPVTELAVIKAGITTDAAPASPAAVLQANQAVAKVLGLTGVDITIRPVPTNSVEFDASKDGLSDSEKYGLLLTKLSGLDSLNGGSLTVSLTQLSQNIDISGNAAITAQGAALVDQGRQQALAALKTAPSASEKTFLTDSTLNRQLLGDVIVTEQTLDAQGKLLVSGSALPGSTVNVTLPSGEVQAVVANSAGVFTLTSATAQPKLEVPLQLTGADGLSQPAHHVAPAAPQIETGNGKVVSGSGTPGSTVTLTGVDGGVIGTALVDALGQWSLVPPTPLADDAVLKASAKDASGNVSGPGAGTVDVEQVSVRLAEAADGYINAAE